MYQTAEVDVLKREAELLQKAAEAAQLARREELEEATAVVARLKEDAERTAVEAEATRQQLSNAVSNRFLPAGVHTAVI